MTTAVNVGTSGRAEVSQSKRLLPVKLWATIGGVLLLFELFVVGKWVTGPNFKTVPSGPSVPPTWMKIVLNSVQIVGTLLLLFCLYWFIIRPWRRQRHVTFDGLLCVAVLLITPYDAMSNYLQPWLTYNSYLVNFGSIMNNLPGTLGIRRPGATEAWPILVIPAVYVCVVVPGAVGACALMRKAREQWPGVSSFTLIVTCYVALGFVVFFLEGLFFMRMGFWTFAGGQATIFGAGHYWKFPLHHPIFASAIFTAFVCLRFFADNKGATIVERGIDQVRPTAWKTVGLRFLAIVAATHAILFLGYHVPQGIIALHSSSWPADLQKRSYLTDRLCGAGTDRACPGPNVPIRRDRSVYLDPAGKVVLPKGFAPPQLVPFEFIGPADPGRAESE